eukprot:TRINITY_DN7705_c0_g1_i1.p1 TRINITY_DN7705_c0_g1~~TRINITY_DN7705_c0_g1_i1.p1  ORF type:complete len:358 (+),score=95.17 TRINITY_DN7705_c0_g1_i1:84-1076(+)
MCIRDRLDDEMNIEDKLPLSIEIKNAVVFIPQGSESLNMLSVSFTRAKIEIFNRWLRTEFPKTLSTPFDIVKNTIVENASKIEKEYIVMVPKVDIDSIEADLCFDDKKMRIARIKKACIEPNIPASDDGDDEESSERWNFSQYLSLSVMEPALEINMVYLESLTDILNGNLEEKSTIKIFRDTKPTTYNRMELYVFLERAGVGLANYAISKKFVHESKEENDDIMRARQIDAEETRKLRLNDHLSEIIQTIYNEWEDESQSTTRHCSPHLTFHIHPHTLVALKSHYAYFFFLFHSLLHSFVYVFIGAFIRLVPVIVRSLYKNQNLSLIHI